MNTYNIQYRDHFNNLNNDRHIAKRFYIDDAGSLLIINEEEEVTYAYARKIWEIIGKI
jgi:hypothetical protein